MWKSAFVGVYQLLNWKMHGETLKCESVHYKVLCFTISKPNYHGRVSFQFAWINSYKCDYRVEINFCIGFVQLLPGVTNTSQ